MAATTRLRAVPGIFLWVVLCVPAPSSATITIDATTRDASCSVVLSAPPYPTAQFVRVKADKTAPFSSGCLAAPPPASLHRPAETSMRETTLAPDPPNVVLSCPPLAPRPPPAA
ncbi:MAG: hypothetical protein ABI665_28120 [Vicinamibacterales bacterium]